MKPVQDVLNRIRWDPQFGANRFAIGYYDRVAERVIVVPFGELIFPPEEHHTFMIIDDAGEAHTIPYHRVRDIYRDGTLIWHRRQPPDKSHHE